MLHPTFLPNPNPNAYVPWERPELDVLTRGIDSTLYKQSVTICKTERQVTLEKIDVIESTPK